MKDTVEELRRILKELKKPDIELEEAITLLERSIELFNKYNEELDEQNTGQAEIS